MDEQVTGEEQRQRAHHRQVAPVFSGQDFQRDDRQKGKRKAEIGESSGGSSDLGGDQHADASNRP